jgi:hypothetical protein
MSRHGDILMKRFFAATLVAVGLTMAAASANAMTPAPMGDVAAGAPETIQVRGGHGHGHMHGGGRGHHYGWNRGRGHHYGWSRGRHRGW